MWTEEMKKWVDMCRHIDYLYSIKEITDVMEGLNEWTKDLEKTEKQIDELLKSFTDEQKKVIFNANNLLYPFCPSLPATRGDRPSR